MIGRRERAVRLRGQRIGRLVVLGVTGLTLALLGGCGTVTPTTGQQYVLGTIIRIAIHERANHDATMEAAFARVAEIEALMSTSEDDYDTTELLRVNRAAGTQPVPVSPSTFAVLDEALRYARLTDGAFDPTVWPVVRLWGIGSDGARVPRQEEIDVALSAVGWERVELADGTVHLTEANMGVDVGGIAKGYAADEAAAILRDAGVTSALLDFGGNILVIGDKPDGTPWRIGVQRPDRQRNTYIGVLSVVDRTIVTSGPYERFIEVDGVRYHHILDPETGYPAQRDVTQVTIIAERSIDADALSTACFVMGLEAGFDLVEALDGVDAMMVTADGEIHATPGAAALFELTDPEFVLVEREG